MKLRHYGSKTCDLRKFKAIKNGYWVKPSKGGLWTSPVDSEWGWKDWNDSEEFVVCDDQNSFIVYLKEDAKILTIDSHEDLLNAPLTDMLRLDFEHIAETYDAIWLTIKGQRDTRFSYPVTLYGWDCETVLILNKKCIIKATQ